MPYMKDDLKKKDSEKLDEMKKEIYEAVTEEAQKLNDEKKQAEESAGSGEQLHSDDKTAEENDAASAIQSQLEEARRSLAEADERFKRLQADFVNFRRRSNQEKSEISDVVLQGFVKDMLPILDNFERALTVESNDDGTALKKGVKMIFNQFNEALTKNGLEVIKTAGEKFDPNFHQAVMRVEDAEKEDNTIEQELQKGYMIHGRVVRPSMVKVVSN